MDYLHHLKVIKIKYIYTHIEIQKSENDKKVCRQTNKAKQNGVLKNKKHFLIPKKKKTSGLLKYHQLPKIAII